jgi:hypothetical protein
LLNALAFSALRATVENREAEPDEEIRQVRREKLSMARREAEVFEREREI